MLLSPGSVIHTQRWANGLADIGVEVVCVSQHGFISTGWSEHVQRVLLPHSGTSGYFLNGGAVARLYAQQRCDLLNAHYATGYGMLATLSRVRPRLVSVWGSDVYDFPGISALHRALVRHVLRSADTVASTSGAMARQVERLMGCGGYGRSIAVTPFGVDTARFSPRSAFEGDTGPLVIGTVKTLAPKYGIDTLIDAFAALPETRDGRTVLLRIVGDGPQRAALEAQASRLDLGDRVKFVGAVAHAQVPDCLRTFDIYAAPSRLDSESFGVAVIEASACGLPVVVCRVGGLPEVVSDGETGLIVERDNPVALTAALNRLAEDATLRRRLGEAGRARVLREYEWSACLQQMEQVYRQLVLAAPGAPSP